MPVGCEGGSVAGLLQREAIATSKFKAASERAKRRFTPLYTNTQNNRIEPKEKPQSHHLPVLRDVDIRSVHVRGSISGYHVDAAMFDTLRALGVLDE